RLAVGELREWAVRNPGRRLPWVRTQCHRNECIHDQRHNTGAGRPIAPVRWLPSFFPPTSTSVIEVSRSVALCTRDIKRHSFSYCAGLKPNVFSAAIAKWQLTPPEALVIE